MTGQAGIGGAAAGGTGGGGGSACPAGSEGCACYGNNTCDGALRCLSKLCVLDGAGGGGGTTGAGGAAGTTGVGGRAGTAGTGGAAGTAGAGGAAGTTGTGGAAGAMGAGGGGGTTGAAGTTGTGGAAGTTGTGGAAGTVGSGGTGGGGAETSIRINEVTSTNPDYIELINIGSTTFDLSGWVITDSMPADSTHRYTLPNGTTLAAGARLALHSTEFVVGLGTVDSVSLFTPSMAAMVDTFSWVGAPSTGNSYSRCPEGTGAFLDRPLTDNAANNCPSN